MLFSPSSIWNAPLPADAPIDPESAQLVSGLLAEVRAEERAGVGPWLATSTASTPIYIVPADEPTVDVSLDDPALPWRRSLARALRSVPIPPGARPARGRDAQMTIWQPATDRLWELFHARLEADGWHAAWGGAMDDVSRSPGYYTAASWPGAQANWGATATSFPVAAGVITLAQIRAGAIDHALALDVPRPRAGVVAWPAQRGDGTGPPSAIPEGAHLRLDPTLDLDALPMPPLTRMIAVAAQRYGLIVRDGAPAISLFAEDPTQYGGGRLYWGRHAIFGGLTPQQILAAFPWSHLQVLRMTLVRVPRASKFLDAALRG
ncbi:MAG TPA: hypothetical protein VKV27_10780 [Solirubrobacteraceae bacterium]|nr:hypothetical protein [Solirubrobacteraceae bacterium]